MDFAKQADIHSRPGKDEDHLLTQLFDLSNEAEDAREEETKREDGTDYEDDLKLYRGQVGPKDRLFDCNFVMAFIDRMVAQLTDNRPIVRVEARKAGLSKVASVLKQVMFGLWDESNVQRQTFKMAHNAACAGSAGIYTGYDSRNNSIYLESLKYNQVLFDPCVTESAMLGKAEYVIIDRVQSLASIRERFPLRGSLVKAESTVNVKASEKPTMLSPLTKLLSSSREEKVSDILPRAHVYEAIIKDYQRGMDGTPLFPFGRQIIYTKDAILSDGPLPYWDGQPPVDWYDWTVDPEHPWGHSAPEMLRRLQTSFDQVMDGTVGNHILSNFMAIIGDHEALTDSSWKSLTQKRSTIVLRKKNRQSSLEIKTPPVFGADKVAIARQIFTYAQLMTGVTDVTLGENPGSLQSGQAVEGLQESANLMTRARSSRLEDFYNRVGTKLVSRIFQFRTSDEVLALMGPTPEAINYAKNRTELFIDDEGKPMDQTARGQALSWLRFSVEPGSSAPGTRLRRGQQMMSLHSAGMASRKRVLESSDFLDADEMLLEAEEDFKKFPPPGWVQKKPGGG